MRRAIVFISIGILGVLWQCGGVGIAAHKSNNGGRETMNEAQKKTVELLTLQDEEYFAFDNERARELQAEFGAMFHQRPPAAPPPGRTKKLQSVLAIGAPSTVDLDRRRDIPILVAIRQSGLREWEVKYDQNACVVMADLRTGTVLLGRPFIKGKRELTSDPSMSGKPPDEINAAAVVNSVRRFDLRKIFDLELRPSRLALTVIVYDWVSNAVVVEIEGAGPEPQEILPQRPSDFLSSTSAITETPKTESPGAALSVPSNVPETAPILIHGAVSIPLERVAVIPAASPERASLILASIVLLKRDERRPVQIDLVIPATIRGQSRTDKMAEASFSFDVRSRLSGRVLSGTYQVYLVVGDRVAGPYPMTVGTP